MSSIKVIKGNKIVRVTENELDKYLSKGYTICDSKLSEPTTQPLSEDIKPAPSTSSVRRKRKQ